MITYEQRLNENIRWAFMEGSMHFEKNSAVHKALEKIARRLEELGIPYAIVGGMALFFHGLRRFTEDVDILVNRAGLQEIHEKLEGLGYLPPFTGSKHLRDAELGVKIEFLVTGDFPGDGKPKAIAFPEPAAASTVKDGMRVVTLPTLVELKLASGMTNSGRLKDLGDVQELIRQLQLPEDFASELHTFVQAKYREIWTATQTAPSGPDQ